MTVILLGTLKGLMVVADAHSEWDELRYGLCWRRHKFGVPTSNQTSTNLADSFIKINMRGMVKDHRACDRGWKQCPRRGMLLTQDRRSSNECDVWKPDPLTIYLGHTGREKWIEILARCREGGRTFGAMEMFCSMTMDMRLSALVKTLGAVYNKEYSLPCIKSNQQGVLVGEENRNTAIIKYNN